VVYLLYKPEHLYFLSQTDGKENTYTRRQPNKACQEINVAISPRENQCCHRIARVISLIPLAAPYFPPMLRAG
jgi:hypothetical protein